MASVSIGIKQAFGTTSSNSAWRPSGLSMDTSVRALAAQTTDRTMPRRPDCTPASAHISMSGSTGLAFLFEHRLGGVLADDMGLRQDIASPGPHVSHQGAGLSDAPFLVVAADQRGGQLAAECAGSHPTCTWRP